MRRLVYERWTDAETGLDCAIRLNARGVWLGYVECPDDLDDLPPFPGGCTGCLDDLVGFDLGHAWDRDEEGRPTRDESYVRARVLEAALAASRLRRPWPRWGREGALDANFVLLALRERGGELVAVASGRRGRRGVVFSWSHRPRACGDHRTRSGEEAEEALRARGLPPFGEALLDVLRGFARR